MMDLTHELFVAEQFWDFLGGEGCFAALLALFEQVGIELRPEFDAAFKRFAP
jgi:type II restriction enzyme